MSAPLRSQKLSTSTNLELLPHTGTFAQVNEILASWFAEAGRDLPWRRTRDPYAILVSEVMLQQTQVSRVVPRFSIDSFSSAFWATIIVWIVNWALHATFDIEDRRKRRA